MPIRTEYLCLNSVRLQYTATKYLFGSNYFGFHDVVVCVL